MPPVTEQSRNWQKEHFPVDSAVALEKEALDAIVLAEDLPLGIRLSFYRRQLDPEEVEQYVVASGEQAVLRQGDCIVTRQVYVEYTDDERTEPQYFPLRVTPDYQLLMVRTIDNSSLAFIDLHVRSEVVYPIGNLDGPGRVGLFRELNYRERNRKLLIDLEERYGQLCAEEPSLRAIKVLWERIIGDQLYRLKIFDNLPIRGFLEDLRETAEDSREEVGHILALMLLTLRASAQSSHVVRTAKDLIVEDPANSSLREALFEVITEDELLSIG